MTVPYYAQRGDAPADMTMPARDVTVRRCQLRDVRALQNLVEASWHAANDPILGHEAAATFGRHVYSSFTLAMYVIYAWLFPRTWVTLVATVDDAPLGFSLLQRDGDEVILYMLYVHPERKGEGIGTALLERAIAAFPTAHAIRLEVLKANTAAIGWYEAKGFQCYGETPNATGTFGVPSLYMDKKLVGVG